MRWTFPRAFGFAVVVCAASCTDDVLIPPGTSWPVPSTSPWADEARFAVTVNLSDNITYVSADPNASTILGAVVVGDVPVELEGPHHLAASPDGSAIYFNLSNYVPGTGSGPHGSHGTGNVPGSLVKLDARTSRKVGEVIVDRSPGDVVLSTDGATAYVTHYDLLRLQAQLATGGPPEAGYSTLAIVDTGTMKRTSLIPVCTTAHGEGLSLDGKFLYVTCAQSDELAIVDVSDGAHPVVTKRVSVGPSPGQPGNPSYGPYALTVSPKDGSVWVSNNNSGDVRVYDPVTAQMDPARTISTGGVTMFGAFSPTGATYYVPHQGDDKLTAIDATTLATTTLPFPGGVCLNAHAFVLSPSGTSGLLVCEGDHVTKPGTVVTISTAPLAMIGFVEVGMFPDGVAWLPPAPGS